MDWAKTTARHEEWHLNLGIHVDDGYQYIIISISFAYKLHPYCFRCHWKDIWIHIRSDFHLWKYIKRVSLTWISKIRTLVTWFVWKVLRRSELDLFLSWYWSSTFWQIWHCCSWSSVMVLIYWSLLPLELGSSHVAECIIFNTPGVQFGTKLCFDNVSVVLNNVVFWVKMCHPIITCSYTPYLQTSLTPELTHFISILYAQVKFC